MNDFMTGLLVVTSEIALVLLLGGVVLLVLFIRRQRKNRGLAKELVRRLHEAEPARREKLVAMLKECLEMENEAAQDKARNLLKCEQRLYGHVLRVFMGHNPEQLLQVEDDVEKLVKNYSHLLEQEDDHDDSKESLIVKLRKENNQLREEKKTLQKNLETTMETLENMMDEYASMYEGGHKEGEQRMKNEMFKLQQKIGKAVSGTTDEESETDEDIPELSPESEEPNPDKGTAGQ